MRKTIVLVTLAILTFALCGCAARKKEPAATVTISVPFSVSSIPLLELDGSKADGSTMTVVTFQDHSVTLAEFISGKTDILMTGFSQGVQARAGNAGITHLATPVWGVSSLMVKEKSTTRTDHLAGKTILVPFQKSPLDLQLRTILNQDGVLDRVIIEYGPIQQAIPLLIAGKCDGIAVPEPFASQLEIEGKAFRLFTFEKAWEKVNDGDGRSPQVSLFVKQEFAESRGQFVNELISLVREKTASTANDPKAMAEKYAHLFGTNAAIVELGITNTHFDVPAFTTSLGLCTSYLLKTGTAAPADDFYFTY